MQGKVYFTKRSATSIVEQLLMTVDATKCLCVYHKRSRVYDDSLLKLSSTGAKFVEFANYGKDSITTLLDDKQATIIIVGLSDMIRPSNRCDIRFEYMYHFAKVGHKYVIDHVPFLEEKWRTWYPYGLIDPGILLYPHSYAIESAYRNYEDGLIEADPLPTEWLVDRIKAWTHIDYRKYFDSIIEFEVHETTERQKQRYAEIKQQLFMEHTTIKPIIAGLAQYCQQICPRRTIFSDRRKLYQLQKNTVLTMTDLNVDWHLRSEIERVIVDTNRLTEGLYETISF